MTLPLGEAIRTAFEAAILAGRLRPGERLPTEQEIMAQYGCSRMTVSKALGALSAAGLIERRKRAGTFVAQPRVHAMVLEVPDLAALVAARGQTYDFLPSRREVLASAPVLGRDASLAGHRVLHLAGVHQADGHPIAIEDRLVSLAAVPEIAGVDFDHVAPGTWLLEHVPWTEADTRITATGANGDEARLLGLEPGAPCLCVERRTWRGEVPITSVRQLFAADAYELEARFGPGG